MGLNIPHTSLPFIFKLPPLQALIYVYDFPKTDSTALTDQKSILQSVILNTNVLVSIGKLLGSRFRHIVGVLTRKSLKDDRSKLVRQH